MTASIMKKKTQSPQAAKLTFLFEKFGKHDIDFEDFCLILKDMGYDTTVLRRKVHDK